MLLTRITDRLRSQNWGALALELIVVVVGIFLAFQVDRWYDQRLLEARENSHLQDLAEDFLLSQADYEDRLKRMRESADSAVFLLSARFEDPITISNPEFYSHMQIALRGADVAPVRRTYDALVATGEIGSIRDNSLRQALAAFFGRTSLRNRLIEFRESQQENIVDPWVIQNLDHVALMRENHPEAPDTSRMKSMHPPEQFHSVMRTPEFEAMLAATWHSAYELAEFYQLELEMIGEIQTLIAKSLERGSSI